MTAECPCCTMSFGGCQCASCEVCGALVFRDEAQQACRCFAHSQLVPDELIVSGGGNALRPNEPRGYREHVLLTPEPFTARARPTRPEHDWTPSTRSLR